ncbi:formylglycine-generating enzyme [Azospirillaceae bacterium]
MLQYWRRSLPSPPILFECVFLSSFLFFFAKKERTSSQNRDERATMIAQGRFSTFQRMVFVFLCFMTLFNVRMSQGMAANKFSTYSASMRVPSILHPVMGQLPPVSLWKSVDSIASGAIIRDCWDCPELVVVEPGKFQMGASVTEEARLSVAARYRDRAMPQHVVEFPTAFAVGRTEVTRGEFARFTEATGYIANGCWLMVEESWTYFADRNWKYPGFEQTDKYPVVCVSWEDARAFTAWLSKNTGETYRLLSEAEWEYIARAGSTTIRWWGNDIGVQRANCAGCLDRSFTASLITAPVGSFPANLFGVYDILGNVSEWVEDCWHENYIGAPNNGDPWVLGRCEFRSLRGGSWLSPPTDLRSAHRDRETPGLRSSVLGFRIARTIRPSKP